MQFSVKVRASKTGSIGSKYIEVRDYVVSAETRGGAVSEAFAMAYAEDLEHCLAVRVREIEA